MGNQKKKKNPEEKREQAIYFFLKEACYNKQQLRYFYNDAIFIKMPCRACCFNKTEAGYCMCIKRSLCSFTLVPYFSSVCSRVNTGGYGAPSP